MGEAVRAELVGRLVSKPFLRGCFSSRQRGLRRRLSDRIGSARRGLVRI
jgi:hypothetical protein